jgi:hypothetical protein
MDEGRNNMTNLKHEIDRHARFGQRLENLTYHAAKGGKIVYHTKRDDLFVSYWSLVFSHSKGIVCLAANELYAPAFALMRPLVEAVVREHIALVGSDDEVKKIRTDRFKVNYDKDGERLDKLFNSGSLFKDFLRTSRDMLHSLTHSGTAQLQHCWDGEVLGSGFSNEQIQALLALSASAVYMTTLLIANHFGLKEQRETADSAFLELGPTQAVGK